MSVQDIAMMHKVRVAETKSAEAVDVSKGSVQAAKGSVDADWNRRQDDGSIRVALIDSRPLTRESISQLLNATGREFVICTFSSTVELLNDCANRSDERGGVVLLSIGGATVGGDFVQECIQQLRKSLPDTPLAILSDREDIECISRAYRCEVRGFIPTTFEPVVVKEAIRLVEAGGTFFPADVVLRHSFNSGPAPLTEKPADSVDPATPVGDLTPRETEVFQGLSKGKSNKLIAYELAMQECTVKVHVRRIMKKLKATNRTQVALLANQMGAPCAAR